MNETAKNLREAANYMADSGANSAHAIATVRGLFDVVESDTFGGDLGRVLNVIADELDELQARAAGANNLRQQLESAEKKAERRKQHIEYLETALHDKNVLFKQRGEALAKVTEENAELRKQVPSERERHILDMWPRFEDGEPVMLGDKYEDNEGHECFASGVHLDIDGPSLVDSEDFHDLYRKGKRVKRPVQSVLDADGVEIKVGDTVWFKGNPRPYAVVEVKDGSVRLHSETYCSEESATTVWTDILTHTRPDSWERLEEDAEFNDETGIVGGNLDIVRRAKALAGVEVSE